MYFAFSGFRLLIHDGNGRTEQANVNVTLLESWDSPEPEH